MATPDPLHAALEVEAFISSCHVDGPDGATWARVPDGSGAGRSTLYHGSAGVVLFYLELHRATDEHKHLDVAIRGGDQLIAALDSAEDASIAIYSGLPGYLFVLNELAKASGLARFRDVAADLVGQMAARSQPLGSGIGWIEPIPFSEITGITGERELLDLSIGAAGAGLGFLYAHRQALDPNISRKPIKTP